MRPDASVTAHCVSEPWLGGTEIEQPGHEPLDPPGCARRCAPEVSDSERVASSMRSDVLVEQERDARGLRGHMRLRPNPIRVLVLDDLALQPIPAARAADLLEVIEDRHGLRSTIVTSPASGRRRHPGPPRPRRVSHRTARRLPAEAPEQRPDRRVASAGRHNHERPQIDRVRRPGTAARGRGVSGHPAETAPWVNSTDLPDYPATPRGGEYRGYRARLVHGDLEEHVP